MKKYRIVNRLRFFTTVIVILAIIFVSMFFVVVNARSNSNVVLVPVYVSEGDNLWKLSSKYSSDHVDIRSYIETVMTINHLSDANIKPGEVLMFPQELN